MSSNGTWVNGRSIVRQKIEKGDRVQIGPFSFHFDGGFLLPAQASRALRIDAQAIGKTAGGTRILSGISLTILPNEFVGLLGPSGAGKSTLMDALNGFRPASEGSVFVNGEELYAQFDSFRAQIGYVPQDDIIHLELPPSRSLRYVGRLRLPTDTPESDLDALITETLALLDLSERRDTAVSALSGGQRKRVSVGVELMTRPSLLFLDEPTSGLDPGTEERLMQLFRKLADQGRTVFCTTHVMENVNLFDLLVVLVKGRLAFFGPPSGALKFFGIGKITETYAALERKTPEAWEEAYRASPFHAEFVAQREQSRPAPSPAPPTPVPAAARRTLHRDQFRVYHARARELLFRDPRNLVWLLATPLILGALAALPIDPATETGGRTLPLFLAVIAIFSIATYACREILKEQSVYRRERMVNLSIPAYLLSKTALLSAVAAVQCFLLITVVTILRPALMGSFLENLLVLMATGVAGAQLGLLLSASSGTQAKAVTLVPLVLVPQIIFSGAIFKLDGFAKFLSAFMPARWAFDALFHNRVRLLDPERGLYRRLARDEGVLLETFLLLLFAAALFPVSAFALKRKDRR